MCVSVGEKKKLIQQSEEAQTREKKETTAAEREKENYGTSVSARKKVQEAGNRLIRQTTTLNIL